jgi:hypothetical protein
MKSEVKGTATSKRLGNTGLEIKETAKLWSPKGMSSPVCGWRY